MLKPVFFSTNASSCDLATAKAGRTAMPPRLTTSSILSMRSFSISLLFLGWSRPAYVPSRKRISHFTGFVPFTSLVSITLKSPVKSIFLSPMSSNISEPGM